MAKMHDNAYRPLKLNRRDVGHDLQLLRDLEIINTRTVSELGPLPASGLPVGMKRRPHLLGRHASTSEHGEHSEGEDMSLRKITVTALLAAGVASCEPAPRPSAVEVPADRAVDTGQESWSPQPQFRKSFQSCQQAAVTSSAKLACIEKELAHQDGVLNTAYRHLHGVLPEKEWRAVQDEQRQWLAEISGACGEDSISTDSLDASYCRLHRTALRAYELQTMIDLDNETGERRAELHK